MAFVEAQGLKAGQLAKEAFEREVHRMRAVENAKVLASFKIKLPKGFAERAFRESRDAR